ncbi:hypothetical protein EBX93_03525 [bacterium]|nr:hypothetical protein [bacterium]
MADVIFNELEQLVKNQGFEKAIDHLADQMTTRKDYNKLFYTLLVKSRVELGLSAIPTAPSSEIPIDKQEKFEDNIRLSARKVAGLFLKENNLEQAWNFYRMIGETEPIKAVIDSMQPKPEDDMEVPIRLAFYEGLNMPLGFEWILERYGLCNAITTLTSQDFSQVPAVREYCLQKLIQALYGELATRLRNEIEKHDGNQSALEKIPAGQSGEIKQLISNRPWLFDEDNYHIDLSHLSSAVQMSIHLPPCRELEMALELCEYGKNLSVRFLGKSEPPFENLYESYAKYLEINAGRNIEKNLDYFRQVARENEPDGSSYPAEILMQLLEKLGKNEEALELAGKTLNASGLYGMCTKASNFKPMQHAAKAQDDPVHFLAALIEVQKSAKP